MASKKSTNKNIVKKENSSDNGYFKVSLDTFLYNAGIVGFIQVLENSKSEKDKDYIIEGQDLSIKKEFIKEIDLGKIFIKKVCNKFEKETFIYQLEDGNTKDKVINEAIKQCKNNKGKYSMAFDMINSLKGKNYKEEFINNF